MSRGHGVARGHNSSGMKIHVPMYRNQSEAWSKWLIKPPRNQAHDVRPFSRVSPSQLKLQPPPIATTLAPALTYVASSSSICLSSSVKTVILIGCRVRGGQRSLDSFASCLGTSDAGGYLHQQMRGDYLAASRHGFHRISKAGNVIRSAILILNSKMPSSVPT